MITYPELRTELLNDPAALGYAPYLTAGSDNKIAVLLNQTTGKGAGTVNLGMVDKDAFMLPFIPFISIIEQLPPERQLFWQLQIAVLNALSVIDVNHPSIQFLLTEAQNDGILKVGDVTALQTRTGSRAEVLFGAGTVVNDQDVAIALRKTPQMALKFTDGGTDHVTTGITTLTAPYSFAAWIYPTALTNNRRVMAKSDPTAGFVIFGIAGAGTGRLVINVDFSTTDMIARGADNTLRLNTWQFVGGSFDAVNGKLYWGSLTETVNEVSYIVGDPIAGVGSIVVPAGALWVGEQENGGSKGFPGRIAWAGAWAVTLNKGEFQNIQKISLRTLRGEPYTVTPSNTFAYWLGKNGVGTQVDLTGHGNTGTVTTATQAPDPLVARARIR